VGVILMRVLFNWALVGLSSLAGASLVAEALNLRSWQGGLAVILLAALGVFVQVSLFRRKR
jgi:hypothetical protein